MTKQDIFYYKVIFPSFLEFRETVKLKLEEHGILSDFIDEDGKFKSPVDINRSNTVDCPLTSLSPKFQAEYREITPEIITLLVNFQEETFSLWLHQEK